ncbi:hypothetical protein BS50DRAFT_365645 [Corynespora cassiicola Philippines]|uniref:Uncharacterized protein n=1 Tax=Corynespora cassiicola Philippines TaxID=1448308 RepID=A0A2T2NSN6_CORCC|nr:hypothetical protein BS50DRAFT_365645 [Corynespora cassiicola Philippines]
MPMPGRRPQSNWTLGLDLHPVLQWCFAAALAPLPHWPRLSSRGPWLRPTAASCCRRRRRPRTRPLRLPLSPPRALRRYTALRVFASLRLRVSASSSCGCRTEPSGPWGHGGQRRLAQPAAHSPIGTLVERGDVCQVFPVGRSRSSRRATTGPFFRSCAVAPCEANTWLCPGGRVVFRTGGHRWP